MGRLRGGTSVIEPATVISRNLAERYLARQLSPAEELEFEEYLLEHPEALDQLDSTRRIKLGLSTLRDRGELSGLVHGRKSWLRAGPLAAAAAIATVAFLGVYQFAWRGTDGPVLSASLQEFAASLRDRPLLGELSLVRTRDPGTHMELVVPPDSGLLALRITPDAPDGVDTFDLILRRKGAEDVATLPGVRPGADGSVLVFLDADRLGTGDYSAELTATAPATGPYEESFAFSLRDAAH